MNVSIIRFPGTNCEFDTEVAFKQLGANPAIVWHKEESLPANTDLVVVAGGFSYGDYLRSGAIARFSPIMQDVTRYANGGGNVVGICNGFQVLTEAGLLPGALKRNSGLHFISKFHKLQIATPNTLFTSKYTKGEIINIPIAHADGNYYIDDEGLKKLQDNDQILVRYVGNPNGSVDDIAGVCNTNRNVFGLMPHPERAMDMILGSADGVRMLEVFVK